MSSIPTSTKASRKRLLRRHVLGAITIGLAGPACTTDPVAPASTSTGGSLAVAGGPNSSGGRGGSTVVSGGGAAPKGGTTSGTTSSAGGGSGAISAGGVGAMGGMVTAGSSAAGAMGGATPAGGGGTMGGATLSGAAGAATGGSAVGAGGGSGAGSGGKSGAGGGSGGTSGGAAGNSGVAGGGKGGVGGGGSGGASGGSGGGSSVTETARVAGWLRNTLAMNAMPAYAYTNISKNFGTAAQFDRLVTAIVESCAAFAPAQPNWIVYCEAVITSAIVAESSYNPALVVEDAYGGAADPTVGLLQNRFSSTVHDFNFYGPLSKLPAIGCTWPTNLPTSSTAGEWRTLGGTSTGLDLMRDPACSVALATWYYFYNATCNGGSSPVYIAQCCAGSGVAGTLVTGLLSHLNGPNGNVTDASNPYVVGIKCCAGGNPTITSCTGCSGRFAAFLGGLPTPDPFGMSLAPEPTKFCR